MDADKKCSVTKKTNKGYGVLSESNVAWFREYIIDQQPNKKHTMRTLHKYIYILTKIQEYNKELDFKTEDDIKGLHRWMKRQDKQAVNEIMSREKELSDEDRKKQRSTFQYSKNYNLVYYSLRTWLLFKEQRTLIQYLSKEKLHSTRRYIEAGEIKLKNTDLDVVLTAIYNYYSTITVTSTKADYKKISYYYDRDVLLTCILQSTGARLSTILQIKWEYFNIEHSRILIPKDIIKGKRTAVLFYHPDLNALLLAFHDKHLKRHKRLFRFDTPDTNVAVEFKHTYGVLYAVSCVEILMDKIELSAGLGKRTLNPHQWRHLLGQTLIQNKTPLIIVKEILTQSALVSAEIYSHLGKSDAEDEYKRIRGIPVKDL